MSEMIEVVDNTKLENTEAVEATEVKEESKTEVADAKTVNNKKKEEVAVVFEELIRGKNDIFDRNYKFKELGKEFRIKVRYPTFIEKGRIHARREELLGGTSYQQPLAIYIVNQTMAILEVCGIDVPEYFSVDGSPRDDVMFKIGMDLDNWLNSFR